MEGGKEYFLKMREEDYNGLTPEAREMFTYAKVVEVNEYETHKDDPIYMKHHKTCKKAKDDKEKYLFDKRHA